MVGVEPGRIKAGGNWGMEREWREEFHRFMCYWEKVVVLLLLLLTSQMFL